MNTQLSVTTNNTMSSLEISKLTGKEHSKVMADIHRILAEVEIGDAIFRDSYLSTQNKKLPFYKLPRRECDLVIAGYSAKYRLAIIDRWQELESKAQFNIPQTYAEALRLCADQQESLDAANLKIESDKPKVDFAMAIRASGACCEVGVFAKVIGWGRNRLFKKMREDGLLDDNNIPYQRYKEIGVFDVDEGSPWTDSKGKSHTVFTTKITGKGQVFLQKKYQAVA